MDNLKCVYALYFFKGNLYIYTFYIYKFYIFYISIKFIYFIYFKLFYIFINLYIYIIY